MGSTTNCMFARGLEAGVTPAAKAMSSPPTPVFFRVMMSSTVSLVNAVAAVSAYTALLNLRMM